MKMLSVHLIRDIVFVISLHITREELSEQPETLLCVRFAGVELLGAFSFLGPVFVVVVWAVLVWIMHEVDDIWVIIIDRSSIVQDVSLAARPILLVLLHHLLVTLTRRVIVRVL